MHFPHFVHFGMPDRVGHDGMKMLKVRKVHIGVYLYRFSYLPWDMCRKNLLLIHSLKALSPSPQSWAISTPSPVLKLIGSSL